MKMLKIGVKPGNSCFKPWICLTDDERHNGFRRSGALKTVKIQNILLKPNFSNCKKNYSRLVKSDASRENFQILSILAQAQKIEHMISLTETQGLDLLLEYLESIYEKIKGMNASKADNAILSHPYIQDLMSNLKKHKIQDPVSLEHPKVSYLVDYITSKIKNNSESRILIFAKLRATVTLLTDKLNKHPGIRAQRFVGQAKKSKKDLGLSQKEQIGLLKNLKITHLMF